MENDLETSKIAEIFGKWLRYMVHGLNILETILEKADEIHKRLKYVGNDVYMWEMT